MSQKCYKYVTKCHVLKKWNMYNENVTRCHEKENKKKTILSKKNIWGTFYPKYDILWHFQKYFIYDALLCNIPKTHNIFKITHTCTPHT